MERLVFSFTSRLSFFLLFVLCHINTNAQIANGHEYVDLGLPSGTLWASCNLGAYNPSDYGNYYAWAEIQPKNYFSHTNLKYCKADDHTQRFSKYVTKSEWGTVDGKSELDIADDAAYISWGGGWRVPSANQMQELKEHCKWTWTIINGHSGCKITGMNGNSIFLPAGGYKNGLEYFEKGKNGEYWSSSLYSNLNFLAQNMYCSLNGIFTSESSRYDGKNIRPVLSKMQVENEGVKTNLTQQSESSNRPSHKSNPNNNKFWFGKCTYTLLDNSGKAIESTMKYQYPQQGQQFEIEIVYLNKSSHPIDIYLNEVGENSILQKSELLIPLLTNLTTVEYKSDGINIFSSKYQIHFSSDGSSILIWSLKNGSYSNASARLYKSGNAAPIYEIRYDVLKENLKKYFK